MHGQDIGEFPCSSEWWTTCMSTVFDVNGDADDGSDDDCKFGGGDGGCDSSSVGCDGGGDKGDGDNEGDGNGLFGDSDDNEEEANGEKHPTEKQGSWG